jgi:cytochrome c biogenesis protein
LEKAKKGVEDVVWDFFCSLKLGISTLILLATTSIVGTVLKQGQSIAEYVQERFGRLYPDGSFPPDLTQAGYDKLKEGFESTYRFYDAFNFFDMYHSWWFLALLALFAMNLICCSINRLPHVLKIVREPELTPDDKFYRHLSNSVELTATGSLSAVQDKVAQVLTEKFAAPQVTEGEDGRKYLFAQKSVYARFGVYVTHLSILVILIGALIGVRFGSKGYVNILEGTSVDSVGSREGRNVQIPLGFSVRCDKFTLEYYAGTQRPKAYRSDLVVIDGGQEVVRKSIVVNDPLNYKGFTFYQSSYGEAGNGELRLRVTPRGGAPVEVTGRMGDHIPLPGGASVAVTKYIPSYQNLGPAIQLHLNTPDGRHGSPFVVFKNYPEFDKKRGDAFAVALLDYQQKFYTGLQVARDPGVEVVWVGCTLMVFGTLIAFFLSHRRIWVTLSAEGDKVKVLAGGNGHRNQTGFALFFDEFKKELQEKIS